MNKFKISSKITYSENMSQSIISFNSETESKDMNHKYFEFIEQITLDLIKDDYIKTEEFKVRYYYRDIFVFEHSTTKTKFTEMTKQKFSYSEDEENSWRNRDNKYKTGVIDMN